jgi:hypothetical protein
MSIHGFIYYIFQRIVVRSHYKPLGLNQTSRKWKVITRLLDHPSSSEISTTGKLERSTGFSCTIHHHWGWTPGRILHLPKLSLRSGIGPHHHPYASFKGVYTKGVSKSRRKVGVSYAWVASRYIIIQTPNSGCSSIPDFRSNTHLPNHQVGAGTPSPPPQLP